MSKKNKDNRHADKLVPSDQDAIQLCVATEERFKKVCNEYERKRGVVLQVPLDLRGDMVKWREMAVRYKNGDHRHKRSELIALRNVAQWTLDVKCRLDGREPVELQWKD